MAKFEKGMSGNPDGRQRKSKPGETLAVSVVNLAIPNQPIETNTSPFFSIASNEEWIPFGSDNLFPQATAAINRQSPIHRGILNNKALYTRGKGFSFDMNNKKLKSFVEKANNKRQSLINVIGKNITDKYHGGNAYLELVKGEGFLNVFHKDYTTARLGKDGTTIKLHGDWARVQSTKGDIKTIPIYPNFGKDGKVSRSILHLKSYEPEFRYYGIPDWIAAMDAAGICYKTNKWNISRLDNSMISSGVLLVEGNISPKEAKKMKADLKKEYVGEGKQGKILFLIKQLGDGGKSSSTNFTPFTDTKDADWLNLHKQSTTDLLVSHNWQRSLSALPQDGGWPTQQILNEYQIAINTVISDEQEFFLDPIKTILQDELQIDASTLRFINKAPVTNQATHTVIIDINTAIAEGKMTTDIGIKILMVQYGYDQDTAAEMITKTKITKAA